MRQVLNEAPIGQEIWKTLFGCSSTAGTIDCITKTDRFERICGRFPPALAGSLTDSLDVGHPKNSDRTKNFLLARLNLSRQLTCLDHLKDHQIEFVVLKGISNAFRLYPTPIPRVSGDLDILIHKKNLDQVASLFMKQGYQFGSSTGLPLWGFTSDASYTELTSPDRVVSIDIHTDPDSYPLALGLPASAVLSQAITLDIAGRTLPVPTRDHAFLLAMSNATKERLEPSAAKAILDGGRMVCQWDLDWNSIESVARRAHLEQSLNVFCRLLTVLGCPHDRIPISPPGSSPMSNRLFNQVAEDWLNPGNTSPSLLNKLLRESLLTADAKVFARRTLTRGVGLIRRRQGIPVLSQE